MRGRSLTKLVAGAATITLLATACGGGGEDDDSGAIETGGELRLYSSEPAFLVPTAADDQPSILVIRQLYRGLVKYHPDTSEVELDLAASIESDDNLTWTVTLKDGYTFTNGEPVDADSFIRAWNYAGYGPNAQNNAYFMNRIAGFDQLQADPPEAEEFSGLTKLDDLTFTVELTSPFSGFPAILGYSGFYPVAQECLDAFDACNETPIGNGPYQIEGSWERNVQITLVRNEDYAGDDPGVADRLIYRIYEDIDAAFAAFRGGELDVMYQIPIERYQEAKRTFPDRVFEVPGDGLTYVGFPLYDERFEDPRLRQAFSLAINRQAIIDAVRDGAEAPATGFVSPNFDGYRSNVCEYCTYDLERAQQLYDDAGGFEGTLELWANAGVGHEIWMQAVGDQLNAAFGVDYELRVDLDFPEYLALADDQGFTGPFRLGWGPDYPVVETYLQPLYGTGASSNNSDYRNPDFDQAIRDGDAAADLDAAIPFYQQAEDLVAADMPVIPMWWRKEIVVYSENVVELIYNKIEHVEYGLLEVAQG